MTVVSVSELKARLSHYLRVVRRGGEIQIVDRGLPVARLTGVADARGQPESDQRDRLIAGGILRPGTGRVAAILDEPPLNLSVSLAEALDAERADRL